MAPAPPLLVEDWSKAVVDADGHPTLKRRPCLHRILTAIIPVRYLLAVLVFLGCANIYALRVNLSVAMIAMVKSAKRPAPTSSISPITPFISENNFGSERLDRCMPSVDIIQHTISDDIGAETGTFEWPVYVQAQLLAAFFYGYLCTQILGGHLAARYGGYRVVGCGVFGIAFLTVFTEVAARAGPFYLFILRVAQGLCEGVAFPAFHTFWSYWAPVTERGRLICISYAGTNVGTVLAMAGTGWISETYGWPAVFYLTGGMALVWCAFWLLLAADEPRQHAFITHEEMVYIIGSTGGESQQARQKAVPPVPWRLLAQSAPIYAICLYSFGSSWLTYTFLTELPAYMNNVLNVSLTTNGLLTALPYVVVAFVNVLSGFGADAAIARGANVTAVRKWFAVTAHILPAPFLLLVTGAGCQFVWVELLLVLSLAASGLATGGITVNHIELAGADYAGILYGLGNTCSSVAGIMVPQIAGWIVGEPIQQSFSTWSTYFLVSVIVIVVSAVIYGVLRSGQRLPWLDDYLALNRPLLSAESPGDEETAGPLRYDTSSKTADDADNDALYEASDDAQLSRNLQRRKSLNFLTSYADTLLPPTTLGAADSRRRKSYM